jgi:DNA-binding XRE family transcriptional regulator
MARTTKIEKIKQARTFDDLLNVEYGNPTTARRQAFERRAHAFVIGEMLRQARQEANLTQEQLAQKAGTQKSYISKLENGRTADVQLSTLQRIVEQGLGKRIEFHIV